MTNKIIKSSLLLLIITIKSQAQDTWNIKKSTYNNRVSLTNLTYSEEYELNDNYQENVKSFYNDNIWIEGEEIIWNKTSAHVCPVETDDSSYTYNFIFDIKNYSANKGRIESIIINVENITYSFLAQEAQIAYKKNNPYEARLLSKLLLEEE